ncbi:MAG: hypothetical protein ACKPKO_11800, partial [Candidatus Fonsibacter sp.]
MIQSLNGDVEAHAWALINSRPVWKRIATRNIIKYMFRNLDVSAHGTNGDPPPPPPPPRGSPPRPTPGGGPE